MLDYYTCFSLSSLYFPSSSFSSPPHPLSPSLSLLPPTRLMVIRSGVKKKKRIREKDDGNTGKKNLKGRRRGKKRKRKMRTRRRKKIKWKSLKRRRKRKRNKRRMKMGNTEKMAECLAILHNLKTSNVAYFPHHWFGLTVFPTSRNWF